MGVLGSIPIPKQHVLIGLDNPFPNEDTGSDLEAHSIIVMGLGAQFQRRLQDDVRHPASAATATAAKNDDAHVGPCPRTSDNTAIILIKDKLIH
ncbi:unnamed protein product [Haemonchus placei]|uniref:GMC_oxred_C domain-containing protein n=1 Tax=Haemonchus placei TaxID=6290 RepID=A0A0N4XBL5_HAEPC|nr:unnamed protein product [Haemonchus placei]